MDVAQKWGGKMRIKLIIDTDIIPIQPFTVMAIESISQMGKLRVRELDDSFFLW